jgi:hypothetical protein
MLKRRRFDMLPTPCQEYICILFFFCSITCPNNVNMAMVIPTGFDLVKEKMLSTYS